MIAFTLGSALGSEGISVPPADCRAAKSLLRSSKESKLLMWLLLDLLLSWQPQVSPPRCFDDSPAGSDSTTQRTKAGTVEQSGVIRSLDWPAGTKPALERNVFVADRRRGGCRFVLRSTLIKIVARSSAPRGLSPFAAPSE